MNQQSSCAPTAVKSKLNVTANAVNLADYTNVPNVASKDHKVKKVGSILVTYKIFPEDIVENFDDLKAKIKAILPENSEIEGYGTDPVAFGLVALLVQIRFPEDKTGIVDELETALSTIKGVSQVQSFNIRRTSR